MNVSDPTEPTLVSVYNRPEPRWIHYLTVRGNYAYLLYEIDDDFQILDVSNPTEPIALGAIDFPVICWNSFALYDSLALIPAEEFLFVANIADPDYPYVIGIHDRPVWGAHALLMDSIIYVSDWSSLLVFKTSWMNVVCGDASGDDVVDLADAVFLINYIFLGGDLPEPTCRADANADGTINVADAVYVISHLYGNGPVPPEGCCP
jgi:hypothetical protein